MQETTEKIRMLTKGQSQVEDHPGQRQQRKYEIRSNYAKRDNHMRWGGADLIKETTGIFYISGKYRDDQRWGRDFHFTVLETIVVEKHLIHTVIRGGGGGFHP